MKPHAPPVPATRAGTDRPHPPGVPAPGKRLEAEANAVALRVAFAGGAPRWTAGDAVPPPRPASDAPVRAAAGRALGRDFSGVRFHVDSAEAVRTRAHAFAEGGEVHFAPGRYRPDHPLGRALIAHELAHVAQQGAAPRLGGDVAAHDALHEGAVSPAAPWQRLRAGCDGCGCDGGPKPQGQGGAAPPSTTPAPQAPGQTTAPQQGTTPQPAPTPPPTPAQQQAAAVAAVESLEVENRVAAIRSSQWPHVVAKLTQRDDLIKEMRKLVKSGSDEDQTLARMQSRYATLRSSAGNASFDAATAALPFTGAEITADQADAAALSGSRFGYVRGGVTELAKALRNYSGQRTLVAEERTEFARFDPSFVVADALTLLGAIQPAGVISAADVKALMAQESGDFTNVEIAGLAGKTKGVVTNRKNPAVVGAAQVKEGARDDAIAWASSKGVTIPDSPDPRLQVASSILLAIAYLGWIADRLRNGLPATQPTGVEFKKLVFAAYNGGHANVIRAAKSAGKKKYGWDEIKNQPSVSGEMRTYVERVFQRLP